MNKRSATILVVVFFVIALLSIGCGVRDKGLEISKIDTTVQNTIESETIISPNSNRSSGDSLYKEDVYFENILSGGVPKDGIPPIENPMYMNLIEADPWLVDEDRVFVLESEEGVFVYPQRVLVWHEIVNETIDGEEISITYCPLTGSCIGYYGPDGTTFGTSGRLLNSNLVMYDRETDTLWSQVMGQAVESGGLGEILPVKPIHWTTWKNVKYTFDDVKVLSDETGFFRDYDRDPYGSYVNDDSYYYNNNVMFPTMSQDDRLPAKKVVVGVKGPNGVLAIDPNYVKKNAPVYTEVGGQSVVAIYDENLEVVRVYKRESFEKPVSVTGLETADYFDVMWFAWVAFYPETELLR